MGNKIETPTTSDNVVSLSTFREKQETLTAISQQTYDYSLPVVGYLHIEEQAIDTASRFTVSILIAEGCHGQKFAIGSIYADKEECTVRAYTLPIGMDDEILEISNYAYEEHDNYALAVSLLISHYGLTINLPATEFVLQGKAKVTGQDPQFSGSQKQG